MFSLPLLRRLYMLIVFSAQLSAHPFTFLIANAYFPCIYTFVLDYLPWKGRLGGYSRLEKWLYPKVSKILAFLLINSSFLIFIHGCSCKRDNGS